MDTQRYYIFLPPLYDKAEQIGAKWDIVENSWYLTDKNTYDMLTNHSSSIMHKNIFNIPTRQKCYTINCFRKKHNSLNPTIHDNDLCIECNFKMKTAGGLKCNGWMSVPCKYNGITVKNSWSCIDCDNDSRCMIGAFDNDNT